MIKNPQYALGWRTLHFMVYGRRGVERERLAP